MTSGTTVTARVPDQMLLLYTDRSDPVTCVILDNAHRFGRQFSAISLYQLVHEVTIGAHWQWIGRTLEPARTAVVNRLAFGTTDTANQLTPSFQKQHLSTWLQCELQRFAYVSSMPTASSLMGCYGSLLDQWSDLAGFVGELRVPVHRAAWTRAALHGDVYAVNPWNLYSLGTRISEQQESLLGARVAYVRPKGRLVHVSQVGSMHLCTNAPQGMTPLQKDYIVSFVNAMASSSSIRILEHAFFVDVGSDLPVFYSTCPVPIITGTHIAYADLVIEGLHDDIKGRSGGTASQTELLELRG
jgi:hypothetical protein